MPRRVDANVRRRDIAAAALAIANESGVPAVTFRRVADRLGPSTSTTAVTHYAPTRGDLLLLTFHHAFDKIHAFATPLLRVLPPRVAMAAVIEGSLPLRKDTRVLARLWIELVMEAERQPELKPALATHNSWFRTEVHRLIERLDADTDAATATDLVVTIVDGIAVAALAEPEAWPPRRQRKTAYRLLAVLGIPALRKPRRNAK